MACWYRFSKPFDFVVKRGVEIAYPAGMEKLVPEAHAKAADAARAGQRIPKPEKRHAQPGR